MFYHHCTRIWLVGGLKQTHLNALAVIEEHVAQLFRHHVQVPLLALVGSGQHVEFGEVR